MAGRPAQFTIRREENGRRLCRNGMNDGVSTLLNDCDTVEEIIQLAGKFGLREEECAHRRDVAPTFQQFRMTIGNRMRGVLSRIRRARNRGEEITIAQAAYPDEATQVA